MPTSWSWSRRARELLRAKTNTFHATVAAHAHSHRVRGTASGAHGCPGALLSCRRAWRGRGRMRHRRPGNWTVSSRHAAAAQRKSLQARAALVPGLRLSRLRLRWPSSRLALGAHSVWRVCLWGPRTPSTANKTAVGCDWHTSDGFDRVACCERLDAMKYADAGATLAFAMLLNSQTRT